ncbi:MAG: response regulator [Pseudomonadota bacterium]|nr:response regulator [Pseudomonadota bacterium]
MKILVIEDDQMIGDTLQRALKKSGYTCDWIQEGTQAEALLANGEYSLVILDLGLPHRDGFSILTAVRAKKIETPILILTARDQVSDRVTGLDAGADDYMLKPFVLEELEARIRMLLRRHSQQKTSLLSFGALSVNTVSYEVTYESNPVHLSSKEYKLLMCFLEKPKVVFSITQLEDKLYGWNEEVASNAIEVHIHQLRKKIDKKAIKNIRNMGYRLGEL